MAAQNIDNKNTREVIKMMNFYFRLFHRLATIIILIVLSSCAGQRESKNITTIPQSEASPTIKPSSQDSAVVSAKSVNEAIKAFEDVGLTIASQKKESLNQDWFPGTIEAASFSTCNSCKKSYIFRFDSQANYERAFEDYSFVNNFYTYGNSKRVLLIVAKDINANVANKYGVAFGAKQSH